MRIWLLILFLLTIGCDRTPREHGTLTLFAAASMTDVMTRIADLYDKQYGQAVHCSFAATSTLARQIEAGAPTDVFVAAHPMWIKYLSDRGLTGPQITIARNSLVVVVPRGAKTDGDLTSLLERGHVAMGNPAHVPAGMYARQALTALGLWNIAQKRMLATTDVRAALRLVEVGEAATGIVYSTDARLTDRVAVALTLADSTHDAIVYTATLVRGGDPAAQRLLQFMAGRAAQNVLRDAGFAMSGDAR